MPKPTAEIETSNALEVVVACYNVFAAGDAYTVTLKRLPRSPFSIDRMREPAFDVTGVQAFDADGNETHADLAPEQHERLCDLAEEVAL